MKGGITEPPTAPFEFMPQKRAGFKSKRKKKEEDS